MDVVGERIAAREVRLVGAEVGDGIAPTQVLREPPPGFGKHVCSTGATEIDLAQEEALVEEARRRHPLQVEVRVRIVCPNEQRIAVVGDEIEHGEHRSGPLRFLAACCAFAFTPRKCQAARTSLSKFF